MFFLISKIRKYGFRKCVEMGILRITKYVLVYSSYCLPIYKECVLFRSFGGMYNDNPKAISELMHQKYPGYPIYWTISEKCKEKLPDYIHTVQYDSFNYQVLLAYARVVVDGGLGMRNECARKGSIQACFIKWFCKKRKGQICISTWHGTPMKKVGMDFKNFWVGGTRDKTDFFSNSSFLLAGCDYTKKWLLEATDNQIPVKLYGTPRNDILFRKDIDINKLKEKLQLPLDKRIVLFAPTWRPYSLDLGGIVQLQTIDIPALLNKLSEKFSGDFVLAFRVHSNVILEINNKKILKDYDKIVIDGNSGDDMAEYLLCSDVLITDYSSSFFDYIITGRPCFLYAPDLEQYEREQGLNHDYNWYPLPKAYTPQELLKCVDEFSIDIYQKNMKTFLETLGNMEDGHASERVVKDIISYVQKTKYGFSV